ncbi:MAG: hypothetical protein J2P54_02010 [Bradyrhizobiaceae bacterium]|nr:hypothetical protein [Bradyrhizobiaceae bacterium]
MPTPLGFIPDPYPGFFHGTGELKRLFQSVPRDKVHKTVTIVSDVPVADFLKDPDDVDGDRRMPDCFWIGNNNYYVSSRFRAVVERYDRDAVEYIEVQFNIPASKKPADAYYYINVLGRGQRIDWAASSNRGRRGRENKLFYHLDWPPANWVMRSPPAGHPAIWHEVHKEVGDQIYCGSGTHVFATNELGDALKAAFPGQVRLYAVRELY